MGEGAKRLGVCFLCEEQIRYPDDNPRVYDAYTLVCGHCYSMGRSFDDMLMDELPFYHPKLEKE